MVNYQSGWALGRGETVYLDDAALGVDVLEVIAADENVEVDLETGIAYTRARGFPLEPDELVRR